MASDVLQYVPVPKDIPPYLGISTPIIVAMVLTEVAYAAWTGKLKKVENTDCDLTRCTLY